MSGPNADEQLAAARAQRPKRLAHRALLMPLWRRWFPALDRLPLPQAHHAVNVAMRDAMRKPVYVLSAVALLAAMLYVAMYYGLHPGMGGLAALIVYGVQMQLAARLLKRRLPELLAAWGVEVGEV
ncbi:hypothetical protein [Pseudoduganella sp.]|uniref:hypothetical protein n=1 Tax=Pseudoduganella sp. TaxID=1880898 RepID=UPI0035B2304A